MGYKTLDEYAQSWDVPVESLSQNGDIITMQVNGFSFEYMLGNDFLIVKQEGQSSLQFVMSNPDFEEYDSYEFAETIQMLYESADSMPKDCLINQFSILHTDLPNYDEIDGIVNSSKNFGAYTVAVNYNPVRAYEDCESDSLEITIYTQGKTLNSFPICGIDNSKAERVMGDVMSEISHYIDERGTFPSQSYLESMSERIQNEAFEFTPQEYRNIMNDEARRSAQIVVFSEDNEKCIFNSYEQYNQYTLDCKVAETKGLEMPNASEWLATQDREL